MASTWGLHEQSLTPGTSSTVDPSSIHTSTYAGICQGERELNLHHGIKIRAEHDNGQEFYPGYQGYNEFFLGQGQDGSIGFLPPSQGTSPLTLDPSMHPPGLGQEGQFLPGDILPPASTPEPMPLHGHDGSFIPRSIPGTPFSQSLSQSLSHHHPEMSEAW